MISQKKVDDNCFIIYPDKVLDNSNAHEMSEAITKVQAEGGKYIIVNLSGLEFISSAGVGSILGSVESSRGKGGDIVLCGASDKIRRIFEILDLCDFFTMVEDEEVARALCPVGD
jgi:anti-sigma B factor antagonist